jgi:hypothetical protein
MLCQMHEPMFKPSPRAGFMAGFKAGCRAWAAAVLSLTVSMTTLPVLTAPSASLPILTLPILALPSDASAAESLHCLTGDEQRTAIANGKTMPLAAVIHTLHRAPKDVIKAQLCQEPDRLIYKLTLLGRDGKVKRATVDASNGAVVGER